MLTIELMAEIARLRAKNERLTARFGTAQIGAAEYQDEWQKAEKALRQAEKHRDFYAEKCDVGEARIAELEAALRGLLDMEMLSYLEYTDEPDEQRFQIGVKAGSIHRAAAALKGDDDES